MKVYDKRIEERILNCTEELIFRRGLRGWNMDQLSAQAGVAKNTLYKIIQSKEQLVENVILNKIRSTQIEIKNILNDEKDYYTGLEKLFNQFPIMISLSSEVIREIYLEYPTIEEKVISQRTKLTQELLVYFQKGIKAGYLNQDLDPEILIQTLQALVLHFIKQEKDNANFEKKLQTSLGYIINGIKT